jgi:hypothetical protein
MRIVATDTIVSRLTFETLLPVFPTGESARQGAGLTLGKRAQFTIRKEGRFRELGLHRAARVVDGGVTATGVLSRQRGNLITIVITIVITHY